MMFKSNVRCRFCCSRTVDLLLEGDSYQVVCCKCGASGPRMKNRASAVRAYEEGECIDTTEMWR